MKRTYEPVLQCDEHMEILNKSFAKIHIGVFTLFNN